jgi:hypothetical protein
MITQIAQIRTQINPQSFILAEGFLFGIFWQEKSNHKVTKTQRMKRKNGIPIQN